MDKLAEECTETAEEVKLAENENSYKYSSYTVYIVLFWIFFAIKFNSDNNLPLNKPLKFQNMTIITRFVFSEGGKFYPQLFLHDTLYELNK